VRAVVIAGDDEERPGRVSPALIEDCLDRRAVAIVAEIAEHDDCVGLLFPEPFQCATNSPRNSFEIEAVVPVIDPVRIGTPVDIGKDA